MAIDRGPFNALVDDDGSNTIGTPWNKAAIAGVILDPVDAAIGSATGPVTALGAASGVDASSAAASLGYLAIPQLALGDYVVVSVMAVLAGGSTPVALTLAAFDPVGAAIRLGITLTGTTGAGDLAPNGVGMFQVIVRPLAGAGTATDWLGTGAVTFGYTQARGFAYAALNQSNLVGGGPNYLYLQHLGIAGGGSLSWSWAAHLVRGAAPLAELLPARPTDGPIAGPGA